MFCQKLKTALDSSGLSRREITERTGIPAASLSQYIHGRNVPAAEKRRQLAQVLGVPEDYFEDDVDRIPTMVRPSTVMTVKEAADRLGVTRKIVEDGLRAKIFPWGYAFIPEGSSHYKYIIIRAKFEADVGGEAVCLT